MSIEISSGTKFKIKPFIMGGSVVIVIPPPLRQYLEIKEGTPCVLVAEDSKKHGKYAGFGKDEKQVK